MAVLAKVSLRGSASRTRADSAAAPAFTLTELIVVIAIIAIVLALALPALSAMTRDARQGEAAQKIQAVLARARYAAIEEHTVTAVRFMPGAWYRNESSAVAIETGRQTLVTYRWTTAQEELTQGTTSTGFIYVERCEERRDIPVVQMPAGMWAAPAEALTPKATNDLTTPDQLATDILAGTTGNFRLTADPAINQDFLNADDFVIAFGADGQLLTRVPGQPLKDWHSPYVMYAFDPPPAPPCDAYRANMWRSAQPSDQLFTRYQFTGLVIYPREGWQTLGPSAAASDRYAYLRRTGQAYLVNPATGALMQSAAIR